MGDEVRIECGDLDEWIEALSRVIAQAVVVVEWLRRARGAGVQGDAMADARDVNGEVVGGGVQDAGSRRHVGSGSFGPGSVSRPPPRHSREVERVLRYIEAHYEEVIGLARLASVAGCSRRRLASVFRRETGETIHHYLMRVRLQRAAMEVRAGDKIEAVMLGVGIKGEGEFLSAVQGAVWDHAGGVSG